MLQLLHHLHVRSCTIENISCGHGFEANIARGHGFEANIARGHGFEANIAHGHGFEANIAQDKRPCVYSALAAVTSIERIPQLIG